MLHSEEMSWKNENRNSTKEKLPRTKATAYTYSPV